MAVKKTELYSTLWKSCEEMRGGIEPSQYKDYILILLFMKYVTDKYRDKKDALLVIPENGGFDDMCQLIGKKNIGEQLTVICNRFMAANDLVGDNAIKVPNFNDKAKFDDKDGPTTLSKMVSLFKDKFNFSRNREDDDDILGDAYEYLMKNFASVSGKSKGQFYTPAEVSRIMARLIDMKDAKPSQKLYDMTCGSGSLLLKAAAETPRGVSMYGQDVEETNKSLALMNMYIHGRPTAIIRHGNTLSDPKFINSGVDTFDFVVANPPFSSKNWRNGFNPNKDVYRRFSYGIPPQKNGDYAFFQHMLKSMRPRARGAIILPHGVLFRGNAEAVIRKNIIDSGVIKGIIGLPPNLFFGTGIPACLIILDKAGAVYGRDIFMMDASKGFEKDGSKNRLREQDVKRIIDVFTAQQDVAKYARKVSFSEIVANDYNLNIPRYIDSSIPEDIQNLDGHLNGGIPIADVEEGLKSYWSVCPRLKNVLFAPFRDGFYNVRPAHDAIRSTIIEDKEFKIFGDETRKRLNAWQNEVRPILLGMDRGVHPRQVIADLSERLLSMFTWQPIIDKYDVYQTLMTYWATAMQDDVDYIAQEGWKAELVNVSKVKTPVYDSELLPRLIVSKEYFPKELAEIAELTSQLEYATSELEALEEEHSGEADELEEFLSEKKRFIKKVIADYMKDDLLNERSEEEQELYELLTRINRLIEDQERLKKLLAKKTGELDSKVCLRYKQLPTTDIQRLVIERKWFAAVSDGLSGQIAQVTQSLTSRIMVLVDRYAETMPTVEKMQAICKERVHEHLKSMGYSWRV
jgi:type I restriction enzyme M protein